MPDPSKIIALEAAAVRALIESIGSDDEDLNHDMAEGETSFIEAVEGIVGMMDDCEVTVEGCKIVEKRISERRQRAEKRAAKLKSYLEQAILISELPSVKIPTATLSLRKVAPKFLVVEESQIPTRFWKTHDPTLDKTALNKAVKDGETIPGTTMSNGGVSLAIRRG